MSIIRKIFGPGNVYQIVLLILLFVVFTNGFLYVNWPLKVKTIYKVFSVIMVIAFITYCRFSHRQHFQYFVLLLAILPFLSVLYSYTEYHQPFFDGIKATLPSLAWLFYFVLHRIKWREGSIMQAFFYIALFIVAVQVIQQFTYPHVLFGVGLEDEMEEGKELVKQRNGLWRFGIGLNGYFTALAMFTIWVKSNKKLTGVALLLFGLMMVSIYLTLTRQVMFSAILILFLSYFIGKEKVQLWAIAIGLLIVGFLYVYFDRLFDEFVIMTETDVRKNNIRFLAGRYFWNETFSSVKAMFLGHGIAFSGSFQHLYSQLKNDNHFYVSDVGFIGMMWRFGVPYVLVCYCLIYNLFWTWRSMIPTSIRLFVLFSTVMSIMIFPMTGAIHYILWSLLLYICDIHINRDPLRRLLILLLQLGVITKVENRLKKDKKRES